jgi:hypothetical protein
VQLLLILAEEQHFHHQLVLQHSSASLPTHFPDEHTLLLQQEAGPELLIDACDQEVRHLPVCSDDVRRWCDQ